MTVDLKDVFETLQKEFPHCLVVGITEEDELLVELPPEFRERELEECAKIKEALPEVSKVTALIQPTPEEAHRLLKKLNQLIKDLELAVDRKPRQLLDIEG